MPKSRANQPAASPSRPVEPSPVADGTVAAREAPRPMTCDGVGVGVGFGVVGVGFGVVGVGCGVVGVGCGVGVTVGLIVLVGPGEGDALPEGDGDADGDLSCIFPCHGLKSQGTTANEGCA
jgi:hypothetical protein